MPDSNRINLPSVLCSCVGQAAILGGFAYGLYDFRRAQLGSPKAGLPLVVEMIPLDEVSTARSGGSISTKMALNPVSHVGKGHGRLPTQPVALVTKSVEQPEMAVAGLDRSATNGDLGASTSSSFSDYQRRLYEALARGSRYPPEARREHLSGVTRLAFKLDRDGKVLDSWIQESSGSEMLDAAALAALDRAQPLPPIPANLPPHMDFVIEIDLSIMQQLAGGASG